MHLYQTPHRHIFAQALSLIPILLFSFLTCSVQLGFPPSTSCTGVLKQPSGSPAAELHLPRAHSPAQGSQPGSASTTSRGARACWSCQRCCQHGELPMALEKEGDIGTCWLALLRAQPGGLWAPRSKLSLSSCSPSGWPKCQAEQDQGWKGSARLLA